MARTTSAMRTHFYSGALSTCGKAPNAGVVSSSANQYEPWVGQVEASVLRSRSRGRGAVEYDFLPRLLRKTPPDRVFNKTL